MGINIIMGIAKLPQVALYWSSDDYFGNQGIKKVMSGNRFEEIQRYLHFNDSSVEPARGTPGFDHLYKIRPIFNSILGKCQTKFKPTKGNTAIQKNLVVTWLPVCMDVNPYINTLKSTRVASLPIAIPLILGRY